MQKIACFTKKNVIFAQNHKQTNEYIMKVVIIEDELDARNVIKFLLRQFFQDDINIVGYSAKVSDSLPLIKKEKPDLIFLDVRLEDGLGLDLLKKIDKIDFQIIFTTAYDNYAIKAIKFAAIDYLLKPINPEEFKTAVQKAIDKKQEFQELLKLQEELDWESEQAIAVKTAEQTHFIPYKDIIRLEADGSYTLIVTVSNKIFASKNLKFFEQTLPDNAFIRTHQSHLVNKKYINFIKNDFIKLENGEEIPVSFRKKNAVKNFLNNKN